MKLLNPRRQLALLQGAYLDVFPYRCVALRNRNATCHRCADACTSGAISFGEEGYVVDPSKCVGCGTCATMCPTCAIEARHPNDADLLAACGEVLRGSGGIVTIACDGACGACATESATLSKPEPEVEVKPEAVVEVNEGAPAQARVTCLGRVEESLLVSLVAAGAREVRLVHGDCEHCPRSTGSHTYPSIVASANELLGDWGAKACVTLRQVTSEPAIFSAAETAPDAGTESAYARARGEKTMDGDDVEDAGSVVPGEGHGAESATDVDAGLDAELIAHLRAMPDGTLPHFVPDRRERLLDALVDLGDPQVDEVTSRLWGHVVIDTTKCRMCFMCAAFCPTGAIAKFKDDEGFAGVDHVPADCVKCRCCQDVCPTGALTLCDSVPSSALLAAKPVEHIELPKPGFDRGGSHSMHGALKRYLKFEQFFER